MTVGETHRRYFSSYADSVFDAAPMLHLSATYSAELYVHPRGRDWTQMENRQRIMGRLFQRMRRLAPGVPPKDVVAAVEVTLLKYPGADGDSPFHGLYGRNPRLPGLYDDPAQLSGADEGTRRELQHLAQVLLGVTAIDTRFRRGLSLNLRDHGFS